jgi:sugar phosphate isomerase/epimerase
MFGSIIQLKSKLYNDEMKDKTLVFRDYPNLKIGFSTQDFQKAMPVDVESLTEIMEYASQEGYQFIMLRDDQAKLPEEDCKRLAQIATKNQIDVIYEIHKNPLDSGYNEVFERGLANTLLFPGPDIIRTLVSKSEFDADPDRKGWNRNELAQLAKLSEASASAAMAKKVSFIVENFNEAFFGDGFTYYGLVDFFANTVFTGLQFDISNPFRNNPGIKLIRKGYLHTSQHLGSVGLLLTLRQLLTGKCNPC